MVKQLKFETIQESWCEYRLEDGTIVKLRLTVAAVEDLGRFDVNSFPIYNLQIVPMNPVLLWSDEAREKARQRIEAREKAQQRIEGVKAVPFAEKKNSVGKTSL